MIPAPGTDKERAGKHGRKNAKQAQLAELSGSFITQQQAKQWRNQQEIDRDEGAGFWDGAESKQVCNVVCSTARLASRPHALRPCARQPRGCHFNWLWPFVMLRATPQLSSALPRPAFGSCQIHPADTYLMGRRRRCSRKRTHTPSGVCSADRNIRAAPARIMIDGQSSQRYVPAAPSSGLAFTACQVQHARATVELTRHPCQLAAHFLPCARPPDVC